MCLYRNGQQVPLFLRKYLFIYKNYLKLFIKKVSLKNVRLIYDFGNDNFI